MLLIFLVFYLVSVCVCVCVCGFFCLRAVICVSNVVTFSGLSVLDWPFGSLKFI